MAKQQPPPDGVSAGVCWRKPRLVNWWRPARPFRRLKAGTAKLLLSSTYTRLFDKSKFIHYRPGAILNNLEFDHADIFRDLADVERTFSHFTGSYQPVDMHHNGDDPNLRKLLPVDWTRCLRVGTGEGNDLQIEGFVDQPQGSSFSLIWQGRHWARIDWKLHGLFNARNAAMAALASALVSGHEDPTAFSLNELPHFKGVARRQDVLFENQHWVVLEDFAHHPTAVSGALEALRAAHPEKPYMCFEPRSNTAAGATFNLNSPMIALLTVFISALSFARTCAEERLDTCAMAKDLIQKIVADTPLNPTPTCLNN